MTLRCARRPGPGAVLTAAGLAIALSGSAAAQNALPNPSFENQSAAAQLHAGVTGTFVPSWTKGGPGTIDWGQGYFFPAVNGSGVVSMRNNASMVAQVSKWNVWSRFHFILTFDCAADVLGGKRQAPLRFQMQGGTLADCHFTVDNPASFIPPFSAVSRPCNWRSRAAAFYCNPGSASTIPMVFWSTDPAGVEIDDAELIGLAGQAVNGREAGFSVKTGSTWTGSHPQLQGIDSTMMVLTTTSASNWTRLTVGSFVTAPTTAPSVFQINMVAKHAGGTPASAKLYVFDWVNQRWVTTVPSGPQQWPPHFSPMPSTLAIYSLNIKSLPGPWTNYIGASKDIFGTTLKHVVLMRAVFAPRGEYTLVDPTQPPPPPPPPPPPFNVAIDMIEVVKTP